MEVSSHSLDMNSTSEYALPAYTLATQPVVVFEHDGKVRRANGAFVRLLGYDTTETAQLTEARMTPECWRETDREAHGLLEASREPVRYEKELLAKNGATIPVDVTLDFDCTTGEKGLRIAFISDRRMRLEVERAKRERDRRFRAIFDHTFQFIGLLDPKGTMLEINRTALDFVGVKLHDVVGRPFWEGPWWSESEELRERLKGAILTAGAGEMARFEAAHRGSDGTEIVVDFSLTPVLDETGQVVMLIPEGRDITERQQTLRAIRESEERFRRLYDEAPVGYHEIDLDGTIVSINRTECEMLGFAREEMLGRSVVDFVAPEQREQARNAVREKIAGIRSLRQTERPYITQDGRRLIMAIHERLRYDDRGQVCGIRTTLQDVTERKRTEAALIASERRNRALFEGIEDAVFVHDFQGKILDANPAACRRLGYSRDELLTLHTKDVDDPEFAAGYEDRLKRQLERGHLSFEGRHRTKDGKITPVEINTSTIVFEDQRAVLAVIRDVTERHALEETRRKFAESQLRAAELLEAKSRALMASEARYRQLTEGTHDAIIVADDRGVITLFNPASERTFEYAAVEAIGMRLSTLLLDDDRSENAGGLERLLTTVDARIVGRTLELQGRRKSGERFPLELSLSAFELEGRMQYICSIRDQTERQRMRAMLVQSEKLASIGLLSAGVAHEINNPLAYVGNNLAVLDRDLKGVIEIMDVFEGGREALAQAAPDLLARVDALMEDLDWTYVRQNLDRMISRTRDGVQRVATIVQNLRGLARTSPPKLEPALVRDLIGPAVEMIHGRGKRKNIEVIVHDPPPIRVPCVTSQISQVILNLLVNAIQAIEMQNRPEGGKVEVISEVRGEMLALSVSDNGSGIAPENLEKLFDPFFTTKAVGEGTGLGLSISHGIINGHGGRIEVKSTLGVGTTFSIYLPLDASHRPNYSLPSESGLTPEKA